MKEALAHLLIALLLIVALIKLMHALALPLYKAADMIDLRPDVRANKQDAPRISLWD